MQFINVRLLITNVQASIAFWRDIMGFHMTYSDENMGYAYFETGGAGIELLTRAAFAAALAQPAPSSPHGELPAVLVFRVDDVDTAYAQFVERGAVAIDAPQDRPEWQARAAHFSDPDGYVVEIYSPLAQTDAPTA